MSSAQIADLSGQVALVTGGSRGIGREIALLLGSCGAKVVVNYAQNADAAKKVVRELEAFSSGHEALGFDVGNGTEADNAVSSVVEKHGRLDILVNNAGIAADGLLVRTKDADWQRTIDVNLSGAFYCSRAVARPMMKAKYGRIISVSSVIGEVGNAGQASYAASKAGLFGLAKSLAKELGSRGVTSNVVTPGYIDTDMTKDFPEDRRQALLSQIPLGRLGDAKDVASLVVFLASPAAGYITGQVLGVNGGLHM